ncbi:MAG: TRAP transporter large permease [Deltaproteobacteria bacterium]|nr:TRAP transporter large permease [Deltaproteobacteria bacterium]
MELGVIIGLVFFFVGIAIGLPLCWVFLGSSAIALLLIDTSLTFMAGAAYHAIDSYVLMAIAFFIFAGNMMSASGIADRLIRLAYALVGRIRGGLVDVGIIATVFMSALTGSSLPCIAALIPVLVPRLEKLGYARSYVTGVLCSSSFLGYLIPPSVPALMYCLVAQQSVAAVFLSTVFPGLLLTGGYMIVNTFIVKRYMQPSTDVPELPETFSGTVKEIGASFWSALPALGCPFVVLVGIYAGICTPNEAGSVAVIYTVLVGMFVYRNMDSKSLWTSALTTLVTLGMITLLLGFGTVFTRMLIREGVGEAMTDFILGFSDNRYLVLALMNILLLVFGMFIDGIPILIIVVPLILPLVTEIDVNLVQLGAIIIVNVGLGVVTPPYAVSIFVGSRLADVPYLDLVKPMMIFLLFVGIPVLLFTTYVPALSLWLPTIILGPRIVGAW